ncbi:MAG: hypothetical protein K9N35_12525 [Candidatus Marinimicrobia bacterium]|nr:hypothetical protein [Candidatus Neomarinimicrobiota bacterium]
MKNPTYLIKESIIFILLSVIIGVSAQSILPNGISVKTEISLLGSDSNATAIPSVSINPDRSDDSAREIKLPAAFSAHQNGGAIFLDARSEDDFQTGHIQGAVNIPVHAFVDSLPYLEKLAPDTRLITYCDGADCNASIELAFDLKMMGFSNVAFFFGGWQEWQQAGYPQGGDSN